MAPPIHPRRGHTTVLSLTPLSDTNVPVPAWLAIGDWPLPYLGRILAAAPPEFQAAVLADAPVLYYQFNESAGAAVNHGSLGTGFNAQYLGTPQRAVATGSGDTGVSFDAEEDYIESAGVAPDELLGNPIFTAEALVFVPANGFATLWAPFLHWGPSVGSSADKTMKSVYFSFSNNNVDRLFAGFYNGGLRTSSPVPLGQWHHIVWVRQGGNPANTGSTFYVNGVAVSLADDPALPANGGTPAVEPGVFRINRAQDFTRFFTGIIDELALYTRALTATEVRAHLTTLGTPTLDIRRLSPTQVEVSWRPAAPGFVLHQSATLKQQDWTPLPSGGVTPSVLTITPAGQYFRLARP